MVRSVRQVSQRQVLKERTTPSNATMATEVDQGLRLHMAKIYQHMMVALLITVGVTFLLNSNVALMLKMANSSLIYVAMFLPLIFVMAFSRGIQQYSLSTVRALFYAYAGSMGVSLAFITILFTGESIISAFLISAIVFGTMSIYGYTTKRDLTSFGAFLNMGVLAMILVSLVNIFFLKSGAISLLTSLLICGIFIGLTAYDTQAIKDNYYRVQGEDMAARAALGGALKLYIDFINIFIYILQFFGQRRGDL